MKTNQKGFIQVIIVVAAVAVIGFLLWTQMNKNQAALPSPANSNSQTKMAAQPSAPAQPEMLP